MVLDTLTETVYYYDSLGGFRQDLTLVVVRWWHAFVQDAVLHQCIQGAVAADGKGGNETLLAYTRRLDEDDSLPFLQTHQPVDAEATGLQQHDAVEVCFCTAACWYQLCVQRIVW